MIVTDHFASLFKQTVATLQTEIPGLGQTVIADVKHIYDQQLYNQRTAAERINSQAKALGIETPKVRNIHSLVNLNTLTYLVINARALQRVRQINFE